MIDKIRIVLAVTYFWAYVGYIISRIFMFLFMILMKLPDICFKVPEYFLYIENSYNEKISILEAKTETKNITNKFKLFLKLQMENAFDKKGIDFRDFITIFGSSILYCYYAISDESHFIKVEKIDDKYIQTKHCTNSELAMKTLYFDGDKQDEEIVLNELSNLINDFQ